MINPLSLSRVSHVSHLPFHRVSKTKYRFSSLLKHLKQQGDDFYLDNYIKSLDFRGVQACQLSDEVFLFGVGQSVASSQESTMQSMADMVLTQSSSISVLQVSPALYQKQQPCSANLIPAILDRLSIGHQIQHYYTIPLMEDIQIHNKESTINKIIDAVQTYILSPQTLYYNYIPLLVLSLLKKNTIYLADMHMSLLFQDVFRRYSYDRLDSLFQEVCTSLLENGLETGITLYQAFLVFQPQIFMFPQLIYISQFIQTIVKNNQDTHVSIYVNQEYYTILKGFYTQNIEEIYKSDKKCYKELMQSDDLSQITDEQCKSIGLMRVIFDEQIKEMDLFNDLNESQQQLIQQSSQKYEQIISEKGIKQ